jgi:cyanophycinase
MQKIVELAKGNPLLVIPMASSIPDTVGWEQRDEFQKMGANAEVLLLVESDSANAEILRKLRTAGGVWFSGGDQNRLMKYIGSSAMRNAIAEAYKNGAVIAGTSAGTAIQSEIMITGEERYPSKNPDVVFGQLRPENVIVARGLGLVTGMIMDQHFVVRRRLNRLINVLADSEANLGAGIDEATALWLKPGGKVEVLGLSQVVLLEKTKNARRTVKENQLGFSGFTLHVLPSGSTFQWTKSGLKSLKLAGNG